VACQVVLRVDVFDSPVDHRMEVVQNESSVVARRGLSFCQSKYNVPCLSGMTLRIDKAGRVILPKPVRDRLGLHAGSDLEIHETPDGVVLKPVLQKPSLVKKGRFWVHTGEIPPGYDILRAIDDDREDRMRKVWGL